jgi:colanic acid/amylovoran biosynthesis glycosyltransferase
LFLVSSGDPLNSGARPVAAFFCATFLKPEMLHIHRHITGLRAFRPVVLAQKREGHWPVENLQVVPRSPLRFLARGREKSTGAPWQISRGETRRFLRLLEAERAALLHVFFGNVAVHLLPLLREVPIPVVVSFHGSDVAGPMAGPAYTAAVCEVFSRAAILPCRSEQLVRTVVRLGAPPEKLRLMRTVVPDGEAVPRTVPADGAWAIVQAARLVPKKGLRTALRAFAEFSRTCPCATFTLAGEGPMEAELRTLAAELQLGDRVVFAGFLDQAALREVFLRSHIFLHPSETANGDVEGVPNAMLEAMATGLPVVATRHGGIPEVVTHGVSGLLAAEGAVDELADFLRQLTSDVALRERISAAGAETVRAEFSAARQMAVIEQLYVEAISAQNNSQPASPHES